MNKDHKSPVKRSLPCLLPLCGTLAIEPLHHTECLVFSMGDYQSLKSFIANAKITPVLLALEILL